MRTSIATVCLSGALTEKLRACAAAGFDGVEIFEPDLTTAPESPEEIRAMAARLGLTLDLYQPFRDAEGVSEEVFADVLRRAEAKFTLMRRLGMDLALVCSNVATASVDDEEVSAAQLRGLADLAARYDVRLAYEALAWGRFIDDYRAAWRVVERADHPNLGTCLDSFHILSRGHDPAAIEQIPAEKIFFVQLADAPALSLDVLSWSRHHRLFPGEGAFDLPDFVTRVLRTGYTGPLSLEVFNDTFRQTDTVATAAHARRSLQWVEDAAARGLGADDAGAGADVVRLTATPPPSGVDFCEIKAEDTGEVEVMLANLGFTPRGRHRTKTVTLWTSGSARVVLNEQHARDQHPRVAAIGLEVPDAGALSRRARELRLPLARRRTHAEEQPLDGAVSPGGTEVFWAAESLVGEPPWVSEFEHGLPETLPPGAARAYAIDHVNLAQPWQVFDESVLFHTGLLGLSADDGTEVAGPTGLVRSQVMRTDDGAVRVPLNVAPPGQTDGLLQHVAFRTDDAIGLATFAREAGLENLSIPDNYYDDLVARFDLDEAFVEELRDLDVLYDRDGEGEFVHFYTRAVGDLFLEFVERRGGYDGYGAANAPVRLAAQRTADAVKEPA